MTIITTKAGKKTLKTSATSINLNVTSEVDFQNVYTGFRNGFASTAQQHAAAAKKLADTKREHLWNDLGAALAVCEVLMAEENVDYLLEAFEHHDIPVVEDPAKANEFVPVLRLIMGYYPPKPKAWKEGDPEPAFAWSRSVEHYAKVLRAAKEKGLTPDALVAQLKADKGMTKLKKADDKRNLKDDTAEQDRITRYKAIINDDPKSVISAEPFALPLKDRPALVALWATVSPDGSLLNIQGRLPTSVSAIEAFINKVSPDLYPSIALRQKNKELERVGQENASLKRQLAERDSYKLTDGLTVSNLGKRSENSSVGETA